MDVPGERTGLRDRDPDDVAERRQAAVPRHVQGAIGADRHTTGPRQAGTGNHRPRAVGHHAREAAVTARRHQTVDVVLEHVCAAVGSDRDVDDHRESGRHLDRCATGGRHAPQGGRARA